MRNFQNIKLNEVKEVLSVKGGLRVHNSENGQQGVEFNYILAEKTGIRENGYSGLEDINKRMRMASELYGKSFNKLTYKEKREVLAQFTREEAYFVTNNAYNGAIKTYYAQIDVNFKVENNQAYIDVLKEGIPLDTAIIDLESNDKDKFLNADMVQIELSMQNVKKEARAFMYQAMIDFIDAKKQAGNNVKAFRQKIEQANELNQKFIQDLKNGLNLSNEEKFKCSEAYELNK